MAENLNVLAVACHPADAFDAVGGTIAKHADRGDHVTVAILTHGVKSHNWALMAREREREVPVTEDEVKAGIEVKENEIKKEGLAILGIEDARFLKYDDAFLQVSERIVLKLADLVREVRPHIVITHCPIEQSGVADQHALCGQMTLLALRRAKEVMPGEKRPPFRALRVYFEATGGTTSILDYARPRFPHVLIDIEDVVVRKVRAMDRLKSQFYDGALGRKVTEVRGFQWGVHARLPYVEAFQLYEPLVHSHLPVTDLDFERASTPLEEQTRRPGKMIAPFVPEEA